jgi:hypothetical protein
MAIVQLKNVEVTRLNGTGNGFGVKEENTSNGKTYKTFWTVWSKEPHGFRVGQTINVSGFLSSKVGDPKTGTDGVERRYVELSINSPRFDEQQTPPAAPAPAQTVQPDAWADTPSYDGQVPF